MVEMGLLAGWGVYTTIRYFIAFTIYTARDRHIALLVLGIASALSFAATLLTFLSSFFAPRLGRRHQSRSLHTRILQTFFSYTASLLLLGPAVADLAFVVIWRHAYSCLRVLVWPKKSRSSQSTECHNPIDSRTGL